MESESLMSCNIKIEGYGTLKVSFYCHFIDFNTRYQSGAKQMDGSNAFQY